MEGRLEAFAALAGQVAVSAGRLGLVTVELPLVDAAGTASLVVLAPGTPADANRRLVILAACWRDEGGHRLARGWAEEQVPEVWLLEPAGELLERLGSPRAGRYRRRELVLPGERVALWFERRVTVVPIPFTRRRTGPPR